MRSRAWLFLPLALMSLPLACSRGGPSPASSAAPVVAAPASLATRLDELLAEGWKKKGVSPTPLVDDATFLRRASLDLLGVLPPPESIAPFEKDTRADKRARLVDDMLKDPRFSDRFANVWTELLLGEARMKDGVDRASFRSWLRARMVERAPWDAIVREIVASEGRNSPGGAVVARGIAAMSTAVPPEEKGVHGAVNYPLRYRTMVEDLAGKTSRTFLGIQIQCAQCHDHKTESWTMADFRGFAAAFVKTRAVLEGDREKGEMLVYEVKDVPKAKLGPRASDAVRAIADVPPRALDGTKLDAGEPRKALAAWMTSPKNPTFAKAFVNRAWAGLLGAGFVTPVDDFRPGNPVDLPEALDLLAADFVTGGFDVRRLVRSICLSAAYQRSAGPPAALWASFALRPLPADVLLDAVLSATGLGPLVEEVAGERADLVRARTRQRFALVLDVDEDAGTHRFEGSIAHALLLSNGVVTRVGASAVEGGALEKLLHGPGTDDQKIDELYLRTLSRRATDEERARAKQLLAAAGPGKGEAPAAPAGGAANKADPLAKIAKRLRSTAKLAREQAYEDLFWALLNASEMALQH